MIAGALIALPVASLSKEREPAATATDVERLRVEVVESHPHDTGAFTQGLELRGEALYESAGRYGESDARIVEPETGAVERRAELPDSAFGEGLTLAGDTVWQLTWREETAIRRDAETLEETGRADYSGEGWGLCHDREGDRLVMSDGSAELTFRDPETFAPLSSTRVTFGGEPLERINELECADGAVWANVWPTDEIVRIDPESGEVEAVVDASGLLSESERSQADVLNGIAVVPGSDTFLVTGKLWPRIFLVRFIPGEPPSSG